MSELHNGRECFGGFVYADRIKELERRGLDPAQHLEARFMKPCPECAIQNFVRSIGVNEMSWENWVDRSALTDALEEFRAWYPRGLNWACLLHGRSQQESRSTGRTHILSAAGTSYIRAERPTRYWNAGDLSIRRYETLGEAIAEFRGLALIDDLGNEANNLDTRDAIDRLLDARYRNQRPSIVTSTLSFDVIEKRYPRFGNRMKVGTAIPWSAAPFNPKFDVPQGESNEHDDDISFDPARFALDDLPGEAATL